MAPLAELVVVEEVLTLLDEVLLLLEEDEGLVLLEEDEGLVLDEDELGETGVEEGLVTEPLPIEVVRLPLSM